MVCPNLVEKRRSVLKNSWSGTTLLALLAAIGNFAAEKRIQMPFYSFVNLGFLAHLTCPRQKVFITLGAKGGFLVQCSCQRVFKNRFL